MSRQHLTQILLPADPVDNMEAATKQYVDAVGAGGIGTVNSFTFNASTTAPPATANIRFNNATQTAVTLIWVSQATFDGLDIAIGLSRVTNDYQLYIQDFDDSTKWIMFDVTGSGTDLGAYWSIPVLYNSGPANLPQQKVAMQTITPANHGIPPGGTDNQVLTKTASANYAVAWETPSASVNPGNFFSFQFNTATTAPTSGSQIRLNNATQASATIAYVRYVASDGTDVHNRLLLSGEGDVLFIQDRDDSTRWQAFDITGDSTDVPASSYVSVPVTFREGGSALIDQAVIAQVLWGGGTSSGGTPVGTKMTALTALAGASAATTDIIEVVDISDTTMAGSGTNKKMTLAELVIFLNANGITVADGDKGEITITSGVWAIEANAVTNTKLADNAVGTAEIIDSSVTLAKMADASVGTVEIVDRAVTAVKQPQATATTLKGNSTGSTADIADISMYTARGMLRRPIVADTTTAFAPVVATHENTMVTLSNASPVVVTLPSDATSAFVIGSEIDFVWLGVGSCSFAQGSSATINSSATAPTAPVMRIRYSAATAKKIAANTWLVVGDLA